MGLNIHKAELYSSFLPHILKDSKTRLFIRNNREWLINALNAVNATTNLANAFPSFFTNEGRTELFDTLFSLPFIPLDVLNVRAEKEFLMPKIKGIGSTGEIIQLLGSRNENIEIEFISTKFFGPLKFILKKILEDVMDSATVVYIIDDTLSVTPALIKSYKIVNEGELKGAVKGTLNLVSIATNTTLFDKTTLMRVGYAAVGYTTNILDSLKFVAYQQSMKFDETNASTSLIGATQFLRTLSYRR